jgi:hypothetical protein
MLTFYVNKADMKLPAAHRHTLQWAKTSLRKVLHRDVARWSVPVTLPNFKERFASVEADAGALHAIAAAARQLRLAVSRDNTQD